MGITSHQAYLQHAEKARLAFFSERQLSLNAIKEQYEALFVVRNIKIDMLFPSFLEDKVIIKSSIETMSPAKITYLQVFYKQEKKIALNTTLLACLNTVSNKPKAIPKEVREHFSNEG